MKRAADSSWDEALSLVPPGQLLYSTRPARAERPCHWQRDVRAALRRPTGTPALHQMVGPDKKVVVLADDVTRPTPQQQVLPPLLTALNEAGVPDRHITVIVALGTHRYMTRAEMREHFGEEICARVNVINHAWKDPDTFVDLGVTPRGTPLKVNRVAHDADVLIGVGSIVPHIYAGWGGGGKIVMPGICSAESIGPVHSLSAEGGGLLYVAGRSGTACRQEIEEAAAQVGLDFILNVVLDAEGTGAWVGAGHPVQAHAAGVAAAEKIFVRNIPAPADIAIVDARPAAIEYWQGIKALGHAARGIRKGGTAILVGDFPEGIETTHPDFSSYALCSEEEIVRAWETGRIADHVAVAPLRLHALARAHCDVICVSSGMSVEDKERLGFRHAASIGEALELALARHSRAARIGVIEFGGDVVPKVAAASRQARKTR